MTTTLNRIQECSPCIEGWTKLLTYLGKTQADDEELSLATILESNGIEDAIWTLRAFDEDSRIRQFVKACAMINIEKIKPYCDETDYSIIIEYLTTDNESLRSAARSAAWSAAWSIAWSARSAAELAARSAAESAAWSAESAAESAAWSAAWSAVRSEITDIFKYILLSDK